MENIFPLYHSCTGGQINIQKSSLYPLSPLSFPSLPNSPPITSSLNILGFFLPINLSNSNSLWSSLQQKLTSRANSLSSRNLSLKGKILLSKSLLLSKVWYFIPICPPSQNIQGSIQTTINNFIWGSSHIHPRFEKSILSLSDGGISLPNFKIECRIRYTKPISHVFDPDPPFWAKAMNQFTINQFSQSLPSCILNRRGTCLQIEPLHSCLNASRFIENLSPYIVTSSPSLSSIHSILLISPSPPYTPFSPSPHIGPLSWREIHHHHHPHKVSDLLWKIAHQNLLIGNSISSISPHSSFCPWCPNIPNSITHLFHSCPFSSTLWNASFSLSHLILPFSSPLSLYSSANHPPFKHMGRLIQSAVLWTIWTSYTSTSFGSASPASSSELVSSFTKLIFFYRSFTPYLPWPSISTISRITSSISP